MLTKELVIKSIADHIGHPQLSVLCQRANTYWDISIDHIEGLGRYDDIHLIDMNQDMKQLIETQIDPQIKSRLLFDKFIKYVLTAVN